MHTEGDWIVDGLEVKSFGHGVIARCPTPNIGGGVMECADNVHLLAASKKLLAACEAIQTARDKCRAGLMAITPQLKKQLDDQLDAAIASAKPQETEATKAQ